MKILHISGARSWGGNEQQLVDVIPELESFGVKSVVFGVKDSPLFFYCQKSEIEFICGKKNKLNKFINYRLLSSIVKNIQPDIIHLHTSDSVTVYTISDLLFNLKTTTVFSKKGISRKVSFLSKFKYNYKGLSKILCVSKVVENHFKDVLNTKNHNKLCVVYDGVKIDEGYFKSSINLKKEYHLSEDVQIVGNIANHNGAKNLPTLIKVLNELVNIKKIKNIHFIQIGSYTNATPELISLAKEMKIEEYITFTDFKEKASSFLPQFDVFLMTSLREGGPTSVLEAFYYKVPVVSTKVGVVTEVIKDGVNGFISDTEDFKSLANNIEILLINNKLKESFQEISYNKFIEKFTTQKLGDKTFKIYKELLKIN